MPARSDARIRTPPLAHDSNSSSDEGRAGAGLFQSRQAVIRQTPFRAKGRLPAHRPPGTVLRKSPPACHAPTYTVAVRTARLTSPWAPRAAADAIRRMDSGSTHQRIYDRTRSARGRSFDSLGVTGKYVFARPGLRWDESPGLRRISEPPVISVLARRVLGVTNQTRSCHGAVVATFETADLREPLRPSSSRRRCEVPTPHASTSMRSSHRDKAASPR